MTGAGAPSPTFQRLVERCGLSPIIARTVVMSSCERAGISPEDLDVDGLDRLLPELHKAISLFKGRDFAHTIVEELKLLER